MHEFFVNMRFQECDPQNIGEIDFERVVDEKRRFGGHVERHFSRKTPLHSKIEVTSDVFKHFIFKRFQYHAKSTENFERFFENKTHF